MKPIRIKVEKIKNNPNNPRIIKDYKFNKLVKSIREFPKMLQLRPIVVDENNVILGGNMRYKAAVKAGLKQVYVIQADDLTEDQKQEFIIKDNSSFGEWDWDSLANEWDQPELADWGLDGFPFNKESIELKDLSDKIQNSYRVEIELENEQEQEKLYNEFLNKGYICRILTL